MVVAECRIDDAAAVVDDHLFVQRRAERLRDAALDLAAKLHWIGDAPGVGGLYAFQNPDLAGSLVHGDAKSLDVEGDRARRSGRCAVRAERSSLRVSGFRDLAERHALPTEHHGV